MLNSGLETVAAATNKVIGFTLTAIALLLVGSCLLIRAEQMLSAPLNQQPLSEGRFIWMLLTYRPTPQERRS